MHPAGPRVRAKKISPPPEAVAQDLQQTEINERALGIYRRVKYTFMGVALSLLGLGIGAWFFFDTPVDGRDPDRWPLLAGAGCLLAGPLMLWQAFRSKSL
jgi:hypothetical protein